jgi:1-acyl-sn-glycerol-3-phosphate acyltransferase
MAEVSETTGTSGAPVPAVGDTEVDTTFTPLYKFLRVLVRGLNRLMFRTTVEGLELVPTEGPMIIAPVHRSGIDFFVASAVTDRKLHYMAKDSLWKRPRFGRFLQTIGAFPVHRDAADREALRRAQRVLDAGEVLVLFPEGERRTGPVVKDLHQGVAFLSARTGAPVVPVGIGGSTSVMPKGAKFPRPRHIHLVVGPPIAAPARTKGGRVPRSQLTAMTDELTDTLQQLYDRSVATTGRY